MGILNFLFRVLSQGLSSELNELGIMVLDDMELDCLGDSKQGLELSQGFTELGNDRLVEWIELKPEAAIHHIRKCPHGVHKDEKHGWDDALKVIQALHHLVDLVPLKRHSMVRLEADTEGIDPVKNLRPHNSKNLQQLVEGKLEMETGWGTDEKEKRLGIVNFSEDQRLEPKCEFF